MNLTITPSRLQGILTIPSSKSAVHRALLVAAFAKNKTKVCFHGLSEDLQATISCLSVLGASFEKTGNAYLVTPISEPPSDAVLDCGESGSTLRFLLPICAALGVHARFICHGRLQSRPLSDLQKSLENHGIVFANEHEISGTFVGGNVSLPGNVSSQYLTGLLFALSLSEEGGSIQLTTPLESASYVRLTEEFLALGKAVICRDKDRYSISSVGRFSPPSTIVCEGDYSNAAFFLGAGATVRGLNPKSRQGDRAILSLLSEMGADVRHEANGDACAKYSLLHSTNINAADIPDLVPPLAVLCATATGTSRISGAARLRLKESDRLQTTAELLRALSVRVDVTDDGLVIHGTGKLSGGIVRCENDHRIAMSAALASCFAEEEITLLGAECVNKSYPAFWEDFVSLGGKIKQIQS